MATALDRVLAGETRAGPRATETRSRVPLLLVPLALALVGVTWARVDDAASLRLLPMSLLVVAWLVAGGVLSARRPSEPLGLLLLALATGASIGMAWWWRAT